MMYDLGNELQRANFLAKAKALAEKGGVAELTEKRPQRSGGQNRYLHAALGYFGAQVGESVEEVKRAYFKCETNPGLFIREKEDPVTGRPRRYLRSTAEMTTAEMTEAIERFRDWSARVAGVYIPGPDDHRLVVQMEIEAERAKRYL
ncbi:MAG: recombination protein NinB [Pseudoflavonifractor sp.]|nr:recombination protein NinB [Alloprevotella sp.]MCM1117625.1 recombination protein NinB [Pseudoflavonifractor sp.]